MCNILRARAGDPTFLEIHVRLNPSLSVGYYSLLTVKRFGIQNSLQTVPPSLCRVKNQMPPFFFLFFSPHTVFKCCEEILLSHVM